MRVAITGASGFVGRAVSTALVNRGDEVVAARRGAGSSPLRWDPRHGFDPPDALSGFDAVVHLAGESIASGRWNDERKAAIRDSREQGTRAVVEAIRKADPRPRVLVNASAVGLFGDRGAEVLDEQSEPGHGFLADVAEAWEAEAERASAIEGVRAVWARFGMVLGMGGGAIPKLLPVFRFGLGGKLGPGDQYMSWIHIDDAAAAILYMLDEEDADGAYNVTAPRPVTNAEFTAAMGKALRRPTFLAVPGAGLRLLFGEMGEALFLQGQRVIPRRLLDEGFRFSFPELSEALADVLG